MRLIFRLLLVIPLMSACDPPPQPRAPRFEASSPKHTTWQWPTLCEVVERLPSADEHFGTFLGTSEAPSTLHPANDDAKVVEAVGIEPTSGNGPE